MNMTLEQASFYVRQLTTFNEDDLPKVVIERELDRFSFGNGADWRIHKDDAWIIAAQLRNLFWL